MKLAFVVLGMHRSGTSSVAGLLALLGATPPKTLMSAKPENPKGFWESEVIMAFNDEILVRANSSWDDPLPLNSEVFDGPQGEDLRQRAAQKLREEFADAPTIVLKDPRICRFYPFWEQVLKDCGYTPLAILPIREPAEVAASLHGRNGMPLDQGLALWRSHVEDAEAATRNQARHILIWTDLLADWEQGRADLEKTFGLTLGRHDDEERTEVANFLTPSLSKHLGRAAFEPDAASQALFERMKTLASS